MQDAFTDTHSCMHIPNWVHGVQLLMPEVFACCAAAPKAAPAGVFSISVDARGGPAAVLFEHAHTPTNRVAHLARQISAAGKPLALMHSLLVFST